jgi:hypothetical protein
LHGKNLQELRIIPREITVQGENPREIPYGLCFRFVNERSEIAVKRKPNEAITPETTALTTEAKYELQEQIRRRAYELYEQHGAEDGRELDNWLQAEAEVTESMARAKAA